MSTAGGAEIGIDLAAEGDFRLGGLVVSPSTCRVTSGHGEARVEPRIMEVLVALWRSAGRTVTREQLIELCWGGRAVSDDAIARAIAKVRQLAQNGGEPHFIVETLSKVGFRLVEATPPEVTGVAQGSRDGKEEVEPTLDVPARRSIWKDWRVVAAAGAVAIVAVIAGAVWTFGLTTPATPPIRGQIALSPFAAVRAEPALAQLSKRTEESITRLLTVPGLLPIAVDGRTADAGNAEFEIAGSADREGDTFVVKARIRDRTSGVVAWSRRFDRRTAQARGFDEEIASTIAQSLRCALKERGAHRLNAAQLSLLLNACGAIFVDTDSALAVTKDLVAAAPDVAGAHALRALALAEYAWEADVIETSSGSVVAELKAAAARALALDPNSALAHLALGYPFGPEPRFIEREESLRRAIALDPELVPARMMYMHMLREVGRLQAARDIAVRSDDAADRRVRVSATHLVLLHAMLGDLASAGALIDRLQRFRPGDARYLRWAIAMWWEDPRHIGPEVWKLIEARRPEATFACWREYLARLTSATAPVRGLPASCSGFPPDWRVRMLSRQGDVDGAYRLMAESPPKSLRWMLFLFYPEMKAFRRDPRFPAIVERLGLLAYWRETNNWPDFCTVEKPPYPCG